MKRALRLQRITFVLVLIAFCGLGWQVELNRGLAHQARSLAEQGLESHEGLCALKANLRQRITDANAFVATHPDGIAGITDDEIRQTIANQQSTLDSLHVLKCPSDPPAKKGAKP